MLLVLQAVQDLQDQPVAKVLQVLLDLLDHMGQPVAKVLQVVQQALLPPIYLQLLMVRVILTGIELQEVLVGITLLIL